MVAKLYEVTAEKRKASARIIVQFIWAMANATNLTNDELNEVVNYAWEHQDMFNKGYFNYKDIIKALKEERDIDLRELLKVL